MHCLLVAFVGAFVLAGCQKKEEPQVPEIPKDAPAVPK
jgi:hypothetical protein